MSANPTHPIGRPAGSDQNVEGSAESLIYSYVLWESRNSTEKWDTAAKIYEMMDHRNASQLYLRSLPIVATTRNSHSLKKNSGG